MTPRRARRAVGTALLCTALALAPVAPLQAQGGANICATPRASLINPAAQAEPGLGGTGSPVARAAQAARDAVARAFAWLSGEGGGRPASKPGAPPASVAGSGSGGIGGTGTVAGQSGGTGGTGSPGATAGGGVGGTGATASAGGGVSGASGGVSGASATAGVGSGGTGDGGGAGTGGVGGTGAVAGVGAGGTGDGSAPGRVGPGTGGGGTGGGGGKGGMGGTGIVGVITGFASICVNGVEVHFDAATPVSDNGRPGTARQLAVGQVVAVRAVGSGNDVRAQSIALLHALVGPVQAVDPAAGTLQVLGERARVLSPAALTGVKHGDWVRLSGHRQANGEVVASRVEETAVPASGEAQVYGRVDALAADALRVNGTLVRLPPGLLTTGLAIGKEALVIGSWDGTRLLAQRVVAEPTREQLGGVQNVVLEGYVQGIKDSSAPAARELNLGHTVLTLDPAVRVRGAGSGGLALDQRVRVTGRVGADQRITVDEIQIAGGGGPSGGGSSSSSSGQSSGSGSSNSG